MNDKNAPPVIPLQAMHFIILPAELLSTNSTDLLLIYGML